jgi:thiol-disulfide isomerase/thioredoxin
MQLQFLVLVVVTIVALSYAQDGMSVDFMMDERVFMVEFYSAMCGSCQEFAPTWAKLEKASKNIVTAKLDIDEPDVMAIADALGVLEEGLPNIRLFTEANGGHKGISILPGIVEPYKDVLSTVKQHLKHLTKRDDGMFIKSHGGGL